MKPAAPVLPSGFPPRRLPGFTLVEVLVSAAIGLALMGAVASILVMTVRTVYKNQQINYAVTNTALVQEKMNREFSAAISQTTPVAIRPIFGDQDPSGATPPRYGQVTYRTPIGSFAAITAPIASDSSSTSVTMTCPADVSPQAGDYFLMDEPDLGTGILISAVSGTGTITLTLAQSIHDGSTEPDKANGTVPAAGKLARIQRERRFETVPPSPLTSPVTELHWFETTADLTKYQVLSTNVDASARYLFSQYPADTVSGGTVVPAAEPAVSWHFSYKTSDTANRFAGGNRAPYYQTAYAEGLVMPKSGNPLSTASIVGGGPVSSTTTLGSSSTTTLGSTTTAGTTTKGTTTAGTTTKGTTTAGSTTTAGTTTAGTTTAGTTTKGTTTKGTTTAGTTTKGTTTAGTTTGASTTTAGTTTKGTTTGASTTTAGTTTKGSTTTAGTTTKGTTTAGTTTKGTTTAGTTTSGTTTKGTTTAGSTTTTGTTTKGTTTAGTTTTGTTTSGTTTKGTTTAGTTTSGTTTKGTTTAASTTTTIPFDG